MSLVDSIYKSIRGIVRLRGATDGTLIGNTGDAIKAVVTVVDGTNPARKQGVSANSESYTRDLINVAYATAALSVTTTAVEAKAASSKLTNRKFVTITPTNGTVYRGSANTVTTTTGTPIFKNQSVTISFSDNVAVWLIAAGTVDVRIEEGS